MKRCWKCGRRIWWNQPKNRSGKLCDDADERNMRGELPWWHTDCFWSTLVDRISPVYGDGPGTKSYTLDQLEPEV